MQKQSKKRKLKEKLDFIKEKREKIKLKNQLLKLNNYVSKPKKISDRSYNGALPIGIAKSIKIKNKK